MTKARRGGSCVRRCRAAMPKKGEAMSGIASASSPKNRIQGVAARGRHLITSSPSRFAIVVFALLILVFTVLLGLPISSASGEATPLSDALFTAVSTICVTGLSTVDMATYWSTFGHTVILVGVQIGAIGVLTLASILGLAISRKLGLRQRL